MKCEKGNEGNVKKERGSRGLLQRKGDERKRKKEKDKSGKERGRGGEGEEREENSLRYQ